MALSTTQVTQITDSVAQSISDFNTNFVTGTSAARATMNTGVGGTGASQTLGRVLALVDLTPELTLLKPMNTVAGNVAATLTGFSALTAYYQQFFPLLDALDTNLSGLNAFLATNTLQVNGFFGSAFNNYATNAVALGYRSSTNVPTAIATAQIFPYQAIDTMWGFTASGATTFSANAVGANVSTAAFGGGVATFYIYKNNAANAIGSATFTITYTNAAGAPATITYSTTSGVPLASGSLAAGYSLTVAGSAITAVTGAGMTSGEQYTIGMKLVRAAGY